MEVLTDLQHIIGLYEDSGFTDEVRDAFQSIIYEYYRVYQRDFPWRKTHDSYAILLSEIMLQQTQTDRVIQKYEAWLSVFPNFATLAIAEFPEVLRLWQGLGYNRRALALHTTAKMVVQNFAGSLPQDFDTMITLPGIGNYTAAAVCNFAFNKPVPLIETNIRAVYLHIFFHEHMQVHDKDLMPLIEQTIDNHDPRLWFYALMDCGAMLKKNVQNPSRKSAHHTRQTKFEGSDRQIRGKIVRILLQEHRLTGGQISTLLQEDMQRVEKIINQLQCDQLITLRNEHYSLRE